MSSYAPQGESKEMQQCIQNCTECHRICLETTQHCLQMGGKHAEAAHIRLMLDCVDMCRTCADFMIRGSDLHPHICAACAEVCKACAESCERIDPNDEQMRRCAEACRRCAESCGQMSKAAA